MEGAGLSAMGTGYAYPAGATRGLEVGDGGRYVLGGTDPFPLGDGGGGT